MHYFFPIIDNGMGLSRTSWAFSMCVLFQSELFRGHKITFQSISYPYCDGAMNIATADFIRSDAQEMVVIDTDVLFKVEHVAWLLSHDEPLVFGMYPKKQVGLNFPLEWLTDDNPFSTDPHVNPLVEVKHTARGFGRFKREVFDKLRPHVETYVDPETQQTESLFWQNMPGGHSEDFRFCSLWRSIGGKVLVDQRCVAQHEGSAVYPIPGTF